MKEGGFRMDRWMSPETHRYAIDRPPQSRSLCFRPVSGLMSGQYPDLRLPMFSHSGVRQMVNSITVAGAVLALPESFRTHQFPV